MTDADTFMKYDYAETKDLLKTFITLISATLVLSITFSDKVVGITNGPIAARITLMVSWALLLLALICAGVAMCFIAAAAGKIIYREIPLFNWSYWSLALMSWFFVLISGGAFVGGLVTMAIAGARSMGIWGKL